jgi:hypothetical protein
MKCVIPVLLLLALAACGVEGSPVPPSPEPGAEIPVAPIGPMVPEAPIAPLVPRVPVVSA